MSRRSGDDSPDAREERISEISRAYATALLSGDEVAAEIAIREALDARLSSAEIDDEVIAPALWLIGELWERGRISVADEHIATEISIRVLALQREAQRVALARGDHLVMLATPSGESHVVALRMTDNLLREAGYAVVMLGADVPAHELAASATRYEPDVIGLSATMPGGEEKLLVAIHEVQQRRPTAAYVVGGRSLTSRMRAQAGIGVCRRVSEAVETVDALVQRADLN